MCHESSLISAVFVFRGRLYHLMLPYKERLMGINGEKRQKKQPTFSSLLLLCKYVTGGVLHLADAPSLLDFAISPLSSLARVCKWRFFFLFKIRYIQNWRILSPGLKRTTLSPPVRPALLHLCWLAGGHDWRHLDSDVFFFTYLFAVTAGPLVTLVLIADIFF